MRDYFEGMALGFLAGVFVFSLGFYVLATMVGGN